MHERSKGHGSLKGFPFAGFLATALLAPAESPAADLSEIDAFQRAVTTQKPEDALAFLRDFESSHLTGDLIELLPPVVAIAVCANSLADPSRARAACDELQRSLAAAPAAGVPGSAEQAAP